MSMNWGNTVANFVKTVNATSKDMQKDIQQVVDRTAKDVERMVKANTPVDSGRLRRGWRSTATGKGSKRIVRISNSVPYAKMVENGTRKMAPRRMLARAYVRGQRLLKRRLTALGRKTAHTFNRG